MIIYTAIDDDTQSFYNKTLLVRAVPELVHDKFGQQRPLKPNSTRKQTFRRYNALTVSVSAATLVEGITPAPLDVTKTDVTCTLTQLGAWTQVSDIATWVSRDKVLTEMAEVLGEHAGQVIDAFYRDIIVAGTNVLVATDSAGATSATRNQANGLINSVFMRKGIRQLKGQNAKFFNKIIKASEGIGTLPVRPSFWSIMHTDTEYDFEEVTGVITLERYPAQTNIMPSETGAFRNLRAVTSTQAKIFLGAGASGTTFKNTAGTNDVYVSLCLAMNAYGIVPLTGHSLENIVKPLGSAGAADALNQRATSGWKAYCTAVILNDAFMVRLEHCASQ